MRMNSVARGPMEKKRRQEAAQKRAGMGSPEPARQIEILDERLGYGVGAVKERARLAALIDPPAPKKKGKKK